MRLAGKSITQALQRLTATTQSQVALHKSLPPPQFKGSN